MIEYFVSGSPSLIVRATHVFLVQVLSAQPGPWAADVEPTEKRAVDLSLRIERMFKGETERAAGDTVKTTVEQWRGTISRTFKLPGPWSGASLEPGTRYVVFAAGDGAAAELLRVPTLVLPESQAVPDVELADEEDSETLPLAAVLEKAIGVADRLGFLFTDYLLERHGATVLSIPKQFEHVARLLESPKLTNVARNGLLHGLASAIDQGRAVAAVEDRFIRALFRLLALPEAGPFANNIVDVYLPGRIARRTARLVFRSAAQERVRAQQSMSKHAGSHADAIREWLAREPPELK
ncbi:MAG: hypothetical protein ABR567_01650 [Myxococcales bacterium]|nr:hypothetical protein [Myxococcales bacterium]